MINAEFFYDGDALTGFSISGHGARDGQDIHGKLVCAAVSSAAYMAANTITEIVKDTPQLTVRDGHMTVENCDSSLCREILSGLKLHITALAAEYPQLITIKNKKESTKNA